MIRLFWTRQQKIVSSQEIGGGIRQPTKPGRTQLVPFIVTWFYSFGKKSLHKSFIYVSKNRLGTMEIRVREKVNLNPKSPQMFRTDYRDCLPNESLSFTALHMSGHSLSVLLLLLSLVVFSIIILINIIIFHYYYYQVTSSPSSFSSSPLSSFPPFRLFAVAGSRCTRIWQVSNWPSMFCHLVLVVIFHVMLYHILPTGLVSPSLLYLLVGLLFHCLLWPHWSSLPKVCNLRKSTIAPLLYINWVTKGSLQGRPF